MPVTRPPESYAAVAAEAELDRNRRPRRSPGRRRSVAGTRGTAMATEATFAVRVADTEPLSSSVTVTVAAERCQLRILCGRQPLRPSSAPSSSVLTPVDGNLCGETDPRAGGIDGHVPEHRRRVGHDKRGGGGHRRPVGRPRAMLRLAPSSAQAADDGGPSPVMAHGPSTVHEEITPAASSLTRAECQCRSLHVDA